MQKKLYCSSALAREPRVQLWLTLTNVNSAENISVNYILCKKQKKSINKISFKIYV